MTQAERDELMDLYAEDALPEVLRGSVEDYLASYPEAAADMATLQAAVSRLKSVPSDRPDAWFAERALDRLLREHEEAQEPAAAARG